MGHFRLELSDKKSTYVIVAKWSKANSYHNFHPTRELQILALFIVYLSIAVHHLAGKTWEEFLVDGTISWIKESMATKYKPSSSRTSPRKKYYELWKVFNRLSKETLNVIWALLLLLVAICDVGGGFVLDYNSVQSYALLFILSRTFGVFC